MKAAEARELAKSVTDNMGKRRLESLMSVVMEKIEDACHSGKRMLSEPLLGSGASEEEAAEIRERLIAEGYTVYDGGTKWRFDVSW